MLTAVWRRKDVRDCKGLSFCRRAGEQPLQGSRECTIHPALVAIYSMLSYISTWLPLLPQPSCQPSHWISDFPAGNPHPIHIPAECGLDSLIVYNPRAVSTPHAKPCSSVHPRDSLAHVSAEHFEHASLRRMLGIKRWWWGEDKGTSSPVWDRQHCLGLIFAYDATNVEGSHDVTSEHLVLSLLCYCSWHLPLSSLHNLPVTQPWVPVHIWEGHNSARSACLTEESIVFCMYKAVLPSHFCCKIQKSLRIATSFQFVSLPLLKRESASVGSLLSALGDPSWRADLWNDTLASAELDKVLWEILGKAVAQGRSGWCFCLTQAILYQSQGFVSVQASGFGKCENELDEIRKGTYLFAVKTGARCREVTGKRDDKFFMTSVYFQLLTSILCQERMGGEEQHLCVLKPQK